jgi:3-deoxy-D-manno-octulosonic-acid transferase
LEAKQLIDLGTAFSVSTKQELLSTVELLLRESDALDAKNKITLDFVKSNQGATKKIMDYLESNMILKKG